MTKNNKILFICPYNKHISGGVKQIYRQVDVLNKFGYNAEVLHKNRNQRCKWFENNSRIGSNFNVFNEIKNLKKNHKSRDNFFYKLWNSIVKFIFSNFDTTTISTETILVFPEIYALYAQNIYPNNKKVIFNQNCFYTFNDVNHTNLIDFSYKNKNIIGTICVSKNSFDYLEFCFPETKIYRINCGINNSIFNFSKQKQKLIAYMPRKLSQDSNQIISILKTRKNISDWKFIEIDNKTESEVASILKKCAIFLSLNYVEGFGLPPAEAIACGCLVIGYTGQGAKEYLIPENAIPIEERNIIDFVKKIEIAIQNFENDFECYNSKNKIASDLILETYSLKNEENAILIAWDTLLKTQQPN